MKLTTIRARLLASTMITGAALLGLAGTGAHAADAADTAAAAATDTTAVQELVVTGSRIPSKNLTSVSPITTVNSQEIKLQGTTNVEDFLDNLPQVFGDQGQFVSNGSDGTAAVDLRGLEPKRTLVLIDGKRLQPGDPIGSGSGEISPDVNFIPPALIDRVEVLTGGASAVYGSDAVAGVVNFIMKKNFQGLQIDAQVSIGMHDNDSGQIRAANALGVAGPHSAGGGVLFNAPNINLPTGTTWAGQRHTITIVGGANTPDDKGNVEFYLGYTEIDPLLESRYDWSACGLNTNSSNTTQQYCGGSPTAAGASGGSLLPLTGPNKVPPTNSYFGVGYQITGTPVMGPNGPLLPSFTGASLYNFAPVNYIQRPDTRYTAGFFATYDVSPAVNFYSSFMFMDDSNVSQVAGSGSFFGENIYTIPCNDPLLSVAQANTLCGPGPYAGGQNASAFIGRRDVEGGGRTSDILHDDYRIVIGSKGDLGGGWNYDLSAQWGETRLRDNEGGYFLNSHLINALDVVPGPGGTAVCASGGSCVPYNIWSPGGITPAALSYLTGDATDSGLTTEQVVTLSINNNLGRYGIKSPWASDGVGISIGGEYRREFLQTDYDSVIESGDLAGFGGAVLDTRGSQSDKDVFGEIRIPLAQDRPFIKDLTFEGGYRYSDYTSGGGNSTYKLGLDWQVVSDIRFRASFERAVRAPNVQELFDPLVPDLTAGKDPCAGASPVLSAAACYLTFTHGNPGVSLAQFTSQYYGSIGQCPTSQCGDVVGGNPDLTPEIANTTSVGFVFTPSFFPGFNLTLDYFDINIQKAIVPLPLNVILNECAIEMNPTYCNLINRDPTTGDIFGGSMVGAKGNVFTQTVNVGSLKTSGFDIESNYRLSLPDWGKHDWGSLSFHYEATYTLDLVTQLPGEQYDCAGLFGTTCGAPLPHYRHQFRVSWNTPWNLLLSVNWRYLGPSNLDFDTNQPALRNISGLVDNFPTDAHISPYSYFDIAFTYKIKDRYTIRGGINNVADRTPPLVDSNSFGISAPSGFGNANTFPQTYTPLGRVFYMGVTADF